MKISSRGSLDVATVVVICCLVVAVVGLTSAAEASSEAVEGQVQREISAEGEHTEQQDILNIKTKTVEKQDSLWKTDGTNVSTVAVTTYRPKTAITAKFGAMQQGSNSSNDSYQQKDFKGSSIDSTAVKTLTYPSVPGNPQEKSTVIKNGTKFTPKEANSSTSEAEISPIADRRQDQRDELNVIYDKHLNPKAENSAAETKSNDESKILEAEKWQDQLAMSDVDGNQLDQVAQSSAIISAFDAVSNGWRPISAPQWRTRPPNSSFNSPQGTSIAYGKPGLAGSQQQYAPSNAWVTSQPHVQTVIVMKKVPVPYPVTVEKQVPVRIAVPVNKPYPVYIPRPYHVFMEKKVPFRVQVPVPAPYAVETRIPVPVKVPVEKPYPVHVPAPYPVYVMKKIPYTVAKEVPVRVPVVRPYIVRVPVEKRVPYPVEKAVPVPVHVPVEKPVPVQVEKKVPVYVEKRVPVYIEKLVPYPVKIPIRVPVPILYQTYTNHQVTSSRPSPSYKQQQQLHHHQQQLHHHHHHPQQQQQLHEQSYKVREQEPMASLSAAQQVITDPNVKQRNPKQEESDQQAYWTHEHRTNDHSVKIRFRIPERHLPNQQQEDASTNDEENDDEELDNRQYWYHQDDRIQEELDDYPHEENLEGEDENSYLEPAAADDGYDDYEDRQESYTQVNMGNHEFSNSVHHQR